MAVASGKAPESAQWLGTGPDKEFPYRSSSSRLGHFVLSPHAAGRGPPKLFCCRCSCCRSCMNGHNIQLVQACARPAVHHSSEANAAEFVCSVAGAAAAEAGPPPVKIASMYLSVPPDLFKGNSSRFWCDACETWRYYKSTSPAHSEVQENVKI